DLLVVPVGPVPLAEFEQDDSGSAGAADEEEQSDSAIPRGGSGVRVKEQDPAEIPPRAVYIERGRERYWRIPCYFNALSEPVRVPVKDTRLSFLLESPGARGSFNALDPLELPAVGKTILVLLTNPLGEKKWTSPQVTMIPIASSDAKRLLLINASHEMACGAIVGDQSKVELIMPRKHKIWSSADEAGNLAVSLAMADEKQRFLPPFHRSYINLDTGNTMVVVAYEVSAKESFRRAKYVRGSFMADRFASAEEYPDE
ncbi:MAG: hypothetical protein ACO3RV_02765, partial [Luteolibacter sp.]